MACQDASRHRQLLVIHSRRVSTRASEQSSCYAFSAKFVKHFFSRIRGEKLRTGDRSVGVGLRAWGWAGKMPVGALD